MQFRYFWKKNRLPFEKRKRLQTGFLQTDLWIKYALKSIEHGDTRVFFFPQNGKSLWQGLGFHLRKSLFYQGGVRNDVNSSRKLKSNQMDITAIWPTVKAVSTKISKNFFAYLSIFWYFWEKIMRHHFFYFEYLS